MTDLVERIVEAWEEIPEWANGSKAEAAIAIVVEEAVKKLSSFKREYDIGDDIHRPMHCRKIDRHNEIMDNIAADLRAMKGKAND